jgi:hypothetical protein
MFYNEVSYSIKAYTVTDIKDRLTEKDVVNFYKKQGYKVYKVYNRRLINQSFSIEFETKICNLFKKYSNGYPDLLLIKGRDHKFVEIKINQDSLKVNQNIFLNELSKLTEVELVYFYDDQYQIKKEDKDIKGDIILKEELLKLKKVAKRKKLKPLWVVSQLYETFGKETILRKNNLVLITSHLSTKKDTVIWFVREVLEKEGKDEKINRKNKRVVDSI